MADRYVRVFAVVDWHRKRVHAITGDQEESGRMVRELCDRYGTPDAATQTVWVVDAPPCEHELAGTAPVSDTPPTEVRPEAVWVCGANPGAKRCTSKNKHRSLDCGWRPTAASTAGSAPVEPVTAVPEEKP